MFCVKCGADIREGEKICPICGASISEATVFTGRINSDIPACAALGKRVKAYLIDLAIVFGLFMLTWSILWGYAVYSLPIIFILYFTLTISGEKSATFGMQLQRIKTIDDNDSGRISILKSFAICFLSLIFFVTGIIFIKDKEGRRVVDMITKTRVVEM